MFPDFYSLCMRVKRGNAAVFETILQAFSPQMKKYSRLLDGNDTCQELTIFLFELIKKLPDNKPCFHDEKILLSYIAKSLKRKYIQLSIKKSKKDSKETELTPAFALADRNHFEHSVLLHMLFNVLSARELRIVYWLYFYGYSAKEISCILHISIQAVNQAKLRALKKLRRALEYK